MVPNVVTTEDIFRLIDFNVVGMMIAHFTLCYGKTNICQLTKI